MKQHSSAPKAIASSPTLDDDLCEAIRHRVAETSVLRVATELGLSREVVTRLAGGLPVRAGTLALAAQRLAAR